MGSPEFEACMKTIAEYSEHLTRQREQIDKQRAAIKARLEEEHEATVEARRSGEYGRTWQVLQQRIDMGQTCDQDIYAGIDKSPEAQEVRKWMGSNVGQLRAYVYDEDNEDTDVGKARMAMEEARTRLHEAQRRFAEQRGQ